MKLSAYLVFPDTCPTDTWRTYAQPVWVRLWDADRTPQTQRGDQCRRWMPPESEERTLLSLKSRAAAGERITAASLAAELSLQVGREIGEVSVAKWLKRQGFERRSARRCATRRLVA